VLTPADAMNDAPHPFLRGLAPTLLVAHRGGAALAPENTLVAFAAALRDYGADMLELDVHATRDGELVVAHDDTLERCTDGEGTLAALTYAELARLDAGHRFTRDGATFPFRGRGVVIPRFADVLRAFPEARLNVDLKPDVAGLEDALAEIVAREKAVDRVCVGSEHDAAAARLVRAMPGACHFYPREALTAFVLSLKIGAEPPESPFQVLDMPLFYEGSRLVDDVFLGECARRKKWVNVWTVDDPNEMAALVAERVGGIITDRPDLLAVALGRPAGQAAQPR
jgi:glycerophosphoryl diester phosphodiesterase